MVRPRGDVGRSRPTWEIRRHRAPRPPVGWSEKKTSGPPALAIARLCRPPHHPCRAGVSSPSPARRGRGARVFPQARHPRRLTPRHEQGLALVEVDSPHGPVVLVEPVDEGAHSVVPQLDHSTVEGGEDPWPLGVEGEALDPVRFGLELDMGEEEARACGRSGMVEERLM